MFLTAPHPTPTKHVIYLIAATLMGIILALGAHAIIEQLYLNWSIINDQPIHWYGDCSLHPTIQIGLIVLGAVGGFFIGRMWWHMVYIDRRWARDKKTNT